MRDIKNYEGLYAVTSCGRVWSYRAKKFLKTRYTKNGYELVDLHKDNNTETFYVHRLVGEAYLPNPNNYAEINHKSERKSENHINNLEYCTRSYNLTYGTRLEKFHKAVYCEELNRMFNSLSEAAKELNLSVQAVCDCVKGRSKTANGKHLRYA